MLETALIILAVALLAACVWLWSQVASERRRAGELAAQLQQATAQAESYRNQNAALGAEIAATRQQLSSAAEKQAELGQMLESADKRLKDTFSALAAEALKNTAEQFVLRAQQVFGAEQQKADAAAQLRQTQIAALLKPVGEGIEKFGAALTSFEKSAKGDYGSLSQLVSSMKLEQVQLRTETANLVTALRRPEVRGRWGEMQLRRVVELAGMIEHCDFEEQASVAVEGGTLRPDMTIRLPSDRTIVVDAKTPLVAYLDSLEAATDEARAVCLERHADQIEEKVRQLSRKEYAAQFERTPDFVVLFIPGECFLQAAAALRPEIMESAMQQRVFIATPTTLISLLRAVAVGWREERLAENAAKISGEAQQLHERLCVLAGHIKKVGDSLAGAVEHYNKFIGSFDTRVMPSVKKLQELHAGSTKQPPEDLPTIDILPREPRLLSAPVTDESVS